MGFERRLFARTDVEVQGELMWQTKRRVGGVKTHTVPMQTIDLSVNGAKFLVHHSIKLPVGASVRVMFHDQSSPARVREILLNDEDTDTKMVRVELESPPDAFMRIIDQWLDANKGGRKFVEDSWFEDGLTEENSYVPPEYSHFDNFDEDAA